jgi:hypothetical protein
VRGWGIFVKAFLFGGVAAILGAAIYYGVIALTNFEIGLVALLIGFMVGAAVRMATKGRGGRRFQVMALVLTYFSVGLAYAPLAVKGAVDAARSDSTGADSAAVAGADSPGLVPSIPPIRIPDSAGVIRPAGDTMSATARSLEPTSIGGIIIGLAAVLAGSFLLTFALPIIYIVGSMPSGLISAIIIGIGMHQAWKMTAAQAHRISGPYRVGSTPPPAT